jgi:two-component system OmpR family sensor kinase
VVRDHGRGLTAAQLEQIQLRHARIGSQHIGYGLGMSIVRTLADKHGAELVFSSPPAGCAQGLEVRLVFPAAAE